MRGDRGKKFVSSHDVDKTKDDARCTGDNGASWSLVPMANTESHRGDQHKWKRCAPTIKTNAPPDEESSKADFFNDPAKDQGYDQ